MTVPAVIRNFEQQASAKGWWNLNNIIVKTLAVFKNAQPTAFSLPNRIEVQKHRQKLGFCVGVYAPVARTCLAANSNHGRAVVEVDVKLICDRCFQLSAVQFVNQALKYWAAIDFT